MDNSIMLPAGLTMDQLDEYARQHYNKSRRECYARHPERALRQRLVSAANLLQREGLLDSVNHAAILAQVRGGAAQ